MRYPQFRDFAEHYCSFTEAELEALEHSLKPVAVAKGEILLRPGEVSRYVYFVLKGCLRFFYLTEDGREITGFIFLEKMFAGSHESFHFQVPGNQTLEALEDCELLRMSHSDLERLYDELPIMNEFIRKIMSERLAFAQRVVASFVMNKPEDRYMALLKRRPELLQRVPQNILSSYLGITPVSLSRIRQRLAKEKTDSDS